MNLKKIKIRKIRILNLCSLYTHMRTFVKCQTDILVAIMLFQNFKAFRVVKRFSATAKLLINVQS